ncbi:MAG: AAA family ATPase [Caldilineaceae bacterium]
MVFISGEAGRGKTTLMTGFARHALATYPDLIVAGGNSEAYAGTGNPYLPFRDILALLTGDMETPGHVRVLSQDQVRRLWTLLPFPPRPSWNRTPTSSTCSSAVRACAGRFWPTPSPPRSAGRRLRRLTSIRVPATCRSAGSLNSMPNCCVRSRAALLLLLDDLQWIDRASADMLFHVARRLTGSRILFLGTFRRSEIETGAPRTIRQTTHAGAGTARAG